MMSGTGEQRKELRLCDFDISEKTGFVPPSPPLTRLPHECFSQWEDLVRVLHTLIAKGTLRDEVCALSVHKFGLSWVSIRNYGSSLVSYAAWACTSS